MSVQVWTPDSEKAAIDVARSGRTLRIDGLGTKRSFVRLAEAEGVVSTRLLTGIVEWKPDDLVVVVRSGTPLRDLQSELLSRGQCLPIPPWWDDVSFLASGAPGTVGGMVAARLPTRWDSWTRGVRYWVLGMRVLLASGEVVRCGSQAVKNVAGYDVQKLFTGSWGSLGLILEVTLRIFPAARLPEPVTPQPPADLAGSYAVVRTLPVALKGYLRRQQQAIERHTQCDVTGTAWICSKKGAELGCPEEGWIIRTNDMCNFPILGANVDIMQRIKKALDPHGIWNPKVMGVL